MGERGPMAIFDERAAEYDAWYDTPSGRATFEAELDVVHPLLAALPRPWLEVDVGTGRFGGSLGVEVGIDPSLGSLILARQRLRVIGEALHSVLIRSAVSSACSPSASSAIPCRHSSKCAGSCGPAGGLVVATVPADSPLDERYRSLGRQGHPFYREAHFFTRKELDTTATAAGFRVVRRRSMLIGFNTGEPTAVPAIDGDDPSAGLRVVLAGVDAR
jgi:hypothetical protein